MYMMVLELNSASKQTNNTYNTTQNCGMYTLYTYTLALNTRMEIRTKTKQNAHVYEH